MTALIVTIHVIVSIALILIVLLQTGKGASMGAVFGGAGSQALFGNTGAATFLGKMTTVAAVVFMITSLSLAYISKSGGKSVVSDIKPAAPATQPIAPSAAPETPAPAGEPEALNATTAEEAPAQTATETVAPPEPMGDETLMETTTEEAPPPPETPPPAETP
jgi:preprotein translocase subunit SecG